jgi:hypothetical protein
MGKVKPIIETQVTPIPIPKPPVVTQVLGSLDLVTLTGIYLRKSTVKPKPKPIPKPIVKIIEDISPNRE